MVSPTVVALVLAGIGLLLVVAGIGYIRTGKSATEGKRTLNDEVTPAGLKKLGLWILVMGILLITVGTGVTMLL
ncbi:MAG: hypothetical protein WBP12_04625 [Candidatus Saccharimonas sp.]